MWRPGCGLAVQVEVCGADLRPSRKSQAVGMVTGSVVSAQVSGHQIVVCTGITVELVQGTFLGPALDILTWKVGWGQVHSNEDVRRFWHVWVGSQSLLSCVNK